MELYSTCCLVRGLFLKRWIATKHLLKIKVHNTFTWCYNQSVGDNINLHSAYKVVKMSTAIRPTQSHAQLKAWVFIWMLCVPSMAKRVLQVTVHCVTVLVQLWRRTLLSYTTSDEVRSRVQWVSTEVCVPMRTACMRGLSSQTHSLPTHTHPRVCFCLHCQYPVSRHLTLFTLWLRQARQRSHKLLQFVEIQWAPKVLGQWQFCCFGSVLHHFWIWNYRVLSSILGEPF